MRALGTAIHRHVASWATLDINNINKSNPAKVCIFLFYAVGRFELSFLLVGLLFLEKLPGMNIQCTLTVLHLLEMPLLRICVISLTLAPVDFSLGITKAHTTSNYITLVITASLLVYFN